MADSTTAPSSSNPGSCNAAAAITSDTLNNALWYRFSPPQTTPVRVTITGTGYDVVSTLWTGTCGALTEMACRDQPEPNSMHAVLEAGGTYWLSVGDFGVLPGGGPTTVEIEVDPDPLINDLCTGAARISTLPSSQAFDNTTANATSPPGTCNSAAAQDAGVLDNSIWFEFTPLDTIEVTATVVPEAPWDPLLLLLHGPGCGALVQAACTDDHGPDQGETLRWTALAGMRYWIVIGDHGVVDGGGPGRLILATPPGACCLGDDGCALMTGIDCAAAGGRYLGNDLDCAAPGPDCGDLCVCEFDGLAGVDVFDLLAYLDVWFAQAPRADIDEIPGVNVFDLLTLLDCWFPASSGEPCG